ncbi:hypothetical protein [Streptomyces sp. NPDC051561]|uniref:hypothetical protein n=1 Tax=Streptomyces sp. NPDC051561 TaxID=3365658 RepID=UPI0037BB9DC3
MDFLAVCTSLLALLLIALGVLGFSHVRREGQAPRWLLKAFLPVCLLLVICLLVRAFQ